MHNYKKIIKFVVFLLFSFIYFSSMVGTTVKKQYIRNKKYQKKRHLQSAPALRDSVQSQKSDCHRTTVASLLPWSVPAVVDTLPCCHGRSTKTTRNIRQLDVPLYCCTFRYLVLAGIPIPGIHLSSFFFRMEAFLGWSKSMSSGKIHPKQHMRLLHVSYKDSSQIV